MHQAVWAPLTAFTTALFAVWWLAHNRRAARIALDQPNERSLHEIPIPRTGGLGLHLGVLTAWLLVAPNFPSVLWLPLICLFAVSLLDDMRGIPVTVRLGIHITAAGFAVITEIQAGLALTIISILAIAWMTNLYNFMDGSDGLAGGMAISGFSVYGIAALFAGNDGFSLIAFSIAAAAAGFLVFNFHPARIFMGDSGSVPLGYLAATLGLCGWQQGIWTLWFPILVFSPFIFDASVTLARRSFRGERVWQAHRDHYYQRLVRMGWGHRKTALAGYLLMAMCGASALACLHLPPVAQWTIITTITAAYLLMALTVDHAWRKHLVARSNEA